MRITPIDDTLVTEGAWVTYMGTKLKVARANNERFKALFRKLSKPHHREIEKETLNEEVAEELVCQAMSQTILVGWDSETFPGNLEYTTENAYALLRDDPDCRDFVMEFARERENYYKEEQEEKLGN